MLRVDWATRRLDALPPGDGSSRGAVRTQWARERASGGQTGIVNGHGFQSPKSVPPPCCDNSLTTLCCPTLPRTEPDRSRGGRGSSELRHARVRADAHGSGRQLSLRRTPLPSTDRDAKLTPPLCGRPSAQGHAPAVPGQPRPTPAWSSPSSSLTGVLGGVCGAAASSGGPPSFCSVSSSRLSAGEQKVNRR